MNKARRKALEEIATRIEELMGDIECVMEEEDEVRDNMAEGSAMYETSEEASDNMQSAIDSLGEALDYLSSAAE